MKILSLLFTLAFALFANDGAHEFAPSKDCQTCHTQIYDEYYGSMHANSTPDKDAIHKVIWDKHPHNTKLEQYSCGKCHTPAANNLDKMLTKGEKAMPDVNNKTHQEAISCAYCHRIQDIEKHKQSNTNIMSKTMKSYFSSKSSSDISKENLKESSYHKIITTQNEHFKNGNVCIGCHSHNVNQFELNICSTNENEVMNYANCVSCHMPKVKGSASTVNDTKTHSFHGFAGAHFNHEMLEKHIVISIQKNSDDFNIFVDNQTSHALLMHPLRLAVLKISVVRANKTIELEKEVFVRVIGKDGKPAMPWVANEVIKDTMLKANEKRTINRAFRIESDDRVDVVLGYFLVNPVALDSLGLKENKAATEFHLLKKESFKF
ncbi:multiheme c-type cytochrome [Sulfurimonas sp.]|uniref:multiheme c-type cytochrome n=1 Tax=Sulfurimonas sp. TaxID=2022749 RepID=UPI0025E941EB|nr:multiheme c-type cytochrome [Sulfurimonas sp.]MDD5157345.1 multiheme c-type cytochrome [Sulfurimonas sp.]